MQKTNERLVIIDGNSIAYRAFYGLPLLKNKNGEYTNAIFGFINMLIKIIDELHPSHLVVVFDFPLRENFRTKLFKDYKATRKPMPDELRQQMPKLKALLCTMGISIFEEQGFEADDVIGTLAKKFCCETVIITGDRDCLQLIDNSTCVLLTKKGLTITQLLTADNFKNEFGFEPSGICDLKAIMGDSSDNIPGIRGIGEKGAADLIKQFKTLEEVYDNLNELPPRQRALLTEQKETAFLSKRLATIDTKMILKTNFKDFTFKLPFCDAVKAEFVKFEFFSLLKNKKLFDTETDSNTNEFKTSAKTLETSDNIIKDEQAIKKFVQSFDNNEAAIVLFENQLFINDTKIYIAGNLLDDGIDVTVAVRVLKPLLENAAIAKIVFDYKTLAHFFATFGVKICGLKEDVQVAEWLVASRMRGQHLEELLKSHGYEEVNAKNLLKVCAKLKERRTELHLNNLYETMELPCLQVLFKMERNGIKISKTELSACEQKFGQQLAKLEEKIFALAGTHFNVNSPKQVCEIIYDRLQIVKCIGGKKSSDISILKKHRAAHPIINLLIEHRALFKLISTYVIPLRESADENSLVHTHFNLTGTITGRLSSSNPNLQNIPTRSENGKSVRAAFISRFDGGALISADYNQIELRLLAHYSGDDKLIAAYQNGEDIHTKTASEIFGIDKNEVSGEVRRHAKAVNFGLIYGISAFGLSEQIGVSPSVAKQYMERYFERFPQIKDYLNSSIKKAKNNAGLVETLFGRRREITEVFDANFNTRGFGERAAMNFPLQGTAADIIKVAMIKVQEEIEKQNLRTRLVLQIHDELVCDAPADEIETVERLLKNCMEGVIKLSVPLVADVESKFYLT